MPARVSHLAGGGVRSTLSQLAWNIKPSVASLPCASATGNVWKRRSCPFTRMGCSSFRGCCAVLTAASAGPAGCAPPSAGTPISSTSSAPLSLSCLTPANAEGWHFGACALPAIQKLLTAEAGLQCGIGSSGRAGLDLVMNTAAVMNDWRTSHDWHTCNNICIGTGPHLCYPPGPAGSLCRSPPRQRRRRPRHRRRRPTCPPR